MLHVIVIIILSVILAEIFSYIWHRFAAHQDYPVIGLHSIHKQHHNADLLDQANGDFICIMALLIVTTIVMMFSSSLISFLSIMIYPLIASFFLLLWTWYIHAAYHTTGHWLENYHWFLEKRRLHFLHHTDPSKNYGIASHLGDVIFGTMQV